MTRENPWLRKQAKESFRQTIRRGPRENSNSDTTNSAESLVVACLLN